MINYVRHFASDSDGAVTVDWVVLTAAVLTLGAIVGASVSTGAETMASNTGNALSAATVPDVSF